MMYRMIAWLFLTIPGFTQDVEYRSSEPQPTGWPLTEEERTFVLKPEYERRPGSESNKHLPELWPLVPSAGFWGSSTWLEVHSNLVEHVQANQGEIDFLLVGDSITQQWGSPLDNRPMNEAWVEHFGQQKVVNIGIGGDKTQNVLWRIDHGGVDGLKPKCIVLMIGNNNMFFVPETGVEAAAKGIKACADCLRRKFPETPIVLVKILPAHEPGNPFYQNIKKTNAALDATEWHREHRITVLDLTHAMLNADGTVKSKLFASDKIHLSDLGYAVYAESLRQTVDTIMSPNKQ